MKNLIIIEAPSNLGLKELIPNKEPGVRKLPDWLKVRGLYEKLSPKLVIRVEPPEYSMQIDEVSQVRNADRIINYSKTLSDEIYKAVKSDQFPFVIGGDCSILIGCAPGLRAAGRYGLFFIDGHTDFILPALSLTKGAAGMDLAIVTGNGPHKLTNIKNLKPYFSENNVVAFGNRYLNNDYVNTILNSSITYYDLTAVRKTGIENLVKQFLEDIIDKKLDGFWIHLDVDVLDDKEMPCVDSRQSGGLTYDELTLTFSLLLQSPMAKGIDITILDPDLDPDGIYTDRFIEQFIESISVFL